MQRKTKFIKDNNNNDLLVYVMECKYCQKEMIFPKQEADKLETLFPIVKEKMEKGSPCVECTLSMEKEESFKLFSDDELEQIRKSIEENN